MCTRIFNKDIVRSSSEVPYTSLGVTDGKPRARGTQKYIKDDDSVCGVDEIPRPEHVSILSDHDIS